MLFISIGIVLVLIALTTYYFSYRPLDVVSAGVDSNGKSKNVRKEEVAIRKAAVVSPTDSSKLEKVSSNSGDENKSETEIQDSAFGVSKKEELSRNKNESLMRDSDSDSSDNSEQPDLSRGTKVLPIVRSSVSDSPEDSEQLYQFAVKDDATIVKHGSPELKEDLSCDKEEGRISESDSAVPSKQEDPYAEENGESLVELSLRADLKNDIEFEVIDLSSEESLCVSTKPDDYIPPGVMESKLLTRQRPDIPNFDSCNVMPKRPPPIPPKPKTPLQQVEKISFGNADSEGKEGDRDGRTQSLNVTSTTESNFDVRSRNRSTNSENDDSARVGRISVKNLALNLKINPLALMPGSKPGKPIVTKRKSLPDEPQEQEQTEEHSSISPELLTNVSKNRAKILRPRRPPTRKPKNQETGNEVLGSSSSEDGMNIDNSRTSET